MRTAARSMLALAALLGAARAGADDATVAPVAPVTAAPIVANFTVKTDASSVVYHLIHKFHQVDGTSKKVEGRARITFGGPTQVGIRVPVESFDSSNVNRDAHMKEVVEAARFPYVEVKLVTDGIAVPVKFPATLDRTWKAQVTFHGVTLPMDVPVSLKFEAANRAVATASLSISLDAFKVERPSLLFVKVDDPVKLTATLTFVQ